MSKEQRLIRDVEAPKYLEYFIVSAVTTILVIRVILDLTGYPQVGNENLHIAHMLWGGLLMMLVIVLFLFFLNVSLRKVFALFGGIGFGIFFDELGKFITSDNDYFFQPTFAILYIFFLVLFLILEYYRNHVELTPTEKNINIEIRKLFHTPESKETFFIIRWYNRFKDVFHNMITKLISYRLFNFVIGVIFFFKGLEGLVILIISLTTDSVQISQIPHIFIIAYGVMVFIILIGIWKLISRNKLEAVTWFRRSVLISLLVIQILVFYYDQLAGFTTLIVNISLLVILTNMKNVLSLKEKE